MTYRGTVCHEHVLSLDEVCENDVSVIFLNPLAAA